MASASVTESSFSSMTYPYANNKNAAYYAPEKMYSAPSYSAPHSSAYTAPNYKTSYTAPSYMAGTPQYKQAR